MSEETFKDSFNEVFKFLDNDVTPRTYWTLFSTGLVISVLSVIGAGTVTKWGINALKK